MQLEDGKGQGYFAGVTNENQLQARAETHTMQHHASLFYGQAFQIIGDFAALNNNTYRILHIKNVDPNRFLVVTYIRLEVVGASGGDFGSPNTYFQFGNGVTYASGGTIVTPVNVNFTSGNAALVEAYDNNPTLTGTFLEYDRWYPDANGSMQTFNKEGSVILGLNNELTISLTTNHTAGTAYARVSFFMAGK
jgi:hypothetical protein